MPALLDNERAAESEANMPNVNTRLSVAIEQLMVDGASDALRQAIAPAAEADRKAASDAAAAAAAAAVNMENDDEEDGVDANGQPAQRSWVWHFFEKVSVIDNSPSTHARCTLLPDPDSPNQAKQHNDMVALSGGLRNLKRHLESAQHEKQLKAFKELRSGGMAADAAAKKIKDDIVAKRKKRTAMFSQGRADDDVRLRREIMLLSWFVERGIAFSAVESPFFHAYHTLANWDAPPNRRRLGEALVETTYNFSMELVVEQLKQADYFSIITDAWTSPAQERYVALNVSFITREFELKVLTLAIIPLTVSHTWQEVTKAIAARVQNALPNDAVLVATVTDNAANFIKVARALHANLDLAAIDDDEGGVDGWDEPVDDNSELTASWRCVAHKMQLAVLAAISEFEKKFPNLLERARAFTRWVRASPLRLAALVRAQAALNKKKLLPIMDVPTRWCSMFYLIERLLELYPAYVLCASRGDFDDLHAADFVSPKDARRLQALLGALQPAEEFVRLVEGEKYQTLEIAPVLLKRCLDSLSPAQQGAAVTSKEKFFRAALLSEVRSRLGWILTRPNLALAAAALSPAYGHLQFVARAVADEQWDELALWVADPVHGFPAPPAPVEVDRNDDEPAIPAARATMSEVKAQLRAVRGTFETKAPATPTEMRRMDTLKWWLRAQRGGTLAAICHLPRIVFSVLATSAPSEREFSSSGVIATARRAALNANRIEMMAFIRSVIRQVGVDAWNAWVSERLRDLRTSLDAQSASSEPRSGADEEIE